MTLRIFVETQPDGSVVALHGWLSSAEVEEVERVVTELGPSTWIDLAHLAGVGEEGLQALRRLEESGTSLTGATPYITLLLGQTTTASPGPRAK